jgi:hypothetical protein
MSTKDYLDSKWPDLHSQPTIEKPITEVNEIDEDIEKQIRQLQEQKFNKGIQNVLPKEVDLLGHRLDSFLSTVKVEKQQLEEKVKKEEIKIGALEDLFSTLKQEKKKPVEEKKVEPKVQIKKEPKKDEANAIKTQEIEAASSVLEYLLPKEVEEYDDNIIDKVSKQISEMKVANELDKNKMRSLRSIDTLEKLTQEFLNFKNATSVQLSTVGGGLDTNKISADLLPTTSGTYDLGSATRPWRKLYLTGGSLIVGDTEIAGTEIAVLDGIIAGQATAGKAVILDPSKGITGLGTVSVTTLSIGGEPITASATELNHVDGVTGNIQTAIDSKATKAFAIAQAVALG